VPLVVALRLKLTVQVPLTAIVPLENVIEVSPALGVNVGVPQLVVVAFGVGAT